MRYKFINNFHNETNMNQKVKAVSRIVVKLSHYALCCDAPKIPNSWDTFRYPRRFDVHETRDKADSPSYNRTLLLS
jgi:hypothetical protein